MGSAISDYNKWLILLSVIQLSGGQCTRCAKSFATNPTNRVKSHQILVASIEFVFVLYQQVVSFSAN
jgi:hypothetical protein